VDQLIMIAFPSFTGDTVFVSYIAYITKHIWTQHNIEIGELQEKQLLPEGRSLSRCPPPRHFCAFHASFHEGMLVHFLHHACGPAKKMAQYCATDIATAAPPAFA
jgi:hypothetical protein